MTTRPLGAQLSHMLKARGVEVIFGIPGVHNQEMYRGIEEAGLVHILARHEQGAGFMADGYARATGRPGVCYVITGPGLCNIMTPMGQAYSDSVPLLVIASCLDETAATRGQLHQMKDQQGAAATVCDWAQTARTADAAYALIDRALGEFDLARPRPKSISVPIAVLEASAVAPPAIPSTQHLLRNDKPSVHPAARLLEKARRPLIIAGGGAIRAASQLEGLAQGLKATSFSTYAGRGIFSRDTTLHLESTLARTAAQEIVAQADVILAVGTELAEVDLWRRDLGHTGTLIRVDLDPEVLTGSPHGQLTIQGDARAVIKALCDELNFSHKSNWSPQAIAHAKVRMRAEIDAERPGILKVADALRAALPPETMIYSDMTQFAYAALENWPMDRPGHWHHPSGFGTLGYALPAAIGGKIGLGDKPVVAIAGDYGFQYTLQDLMVAVELELNLPIIIWDNGRLGEIEDGMIAAQIAPNAVVQRNPDFVKLADAYGAASAQPDSLAQMQDAVRHALARNGPTIIHLRAEHLA